MLVKNFVIEFQTLYFYYPFLYILQKRFIVFMFYNVLLFSVYDLTFANSVNNKTIASTM